MFLLKLNKTACLFSFCVLWICIYELIITVYSRERIRISPAFLKPCLFELQHIYRLNHLLQTVDMHSFSVYRTVQFSAGERHKKKKNSLHCPFAPLSASLQRDRGKEVERQREARVFRSGEGGGRDFGKWAALQQLGVGSARGRRQKRQRREGNRMRGAGEVY